MPTFFSKLLPGVHSMRHRRAWASGAARFSTSLDGGILPCLLLWTEKGGTGKTCTAASPSTSSIGGLLRPVCSGAKQPVQMGSVSSRHRGPDTGSLTSW